MSSTNRWRDYTPFRLFFLADVQVQAGDVRRLFDYLCSTFSDAGIVYRFNELGQLQYQTMPPGRETARIWYHRSGFYRQLVQRLKQVIQTDDAPQEYVDDQSYLQLQYWLEQRWWTGQLQQIAASWRPPRTRSRSRVLMPFLYTSPAHC